MKQTQNRTVINVLENKKKMFQLINFRGKEHSIRKEGHADRVIKRLKDESNILYGTDFTKKYFSRKQKELRYASEMGDLGNVRKNIAVAYKKYRVRKDVVIRKFIGGERKDKNTGYKVKNYSKQIPYPYAKSNCQMMTVLACNYLNFSGDIEGFFELRQDILNKTNDVNDRLFIAQESSEAVMQFYNREPEINRTALIDVAETFLAEIKKSGKPLKYYAGSIAYYYYLGGIIEKSIYYQEISNRYIADVIGTDSPSYGAELSMMAVYQYESGEIYKAIENTYQSLTLMQQYRNPKIKIDKVSNFYANIHSNENLTGKRSPEKHFFLGVIAKEHMPTIAKAHLKKYISLGGSTKFYNQAKRYLEELDGGQ